eukprot:Nk52_evm9s2152 gene=Nk52_evmTU9s2152
MSASLRSGTPYERPQNKGFLNRVKDAVSSTIPWSFLGYSEANNNNNNTNSTTVHNNSTSLASSLPSSSSSPSSSQNNAASSSEPLSKRLRTLSNSFPGEIPPPSMPVVAESSSSGGKKDEAITSSYSSSKVPAVVTRPRSKGSLSKNIKSVNNERDKRGNPIEWKPLGGSEYAEDMISSVPAFPVAKDSSIKLQVGGTSSSGNNVDGRKDATPVRSAVISSEIKGKITPAEYNKFTRLLATMVEEDGTSEEKGKAVDFSRTNFAGENDDIGIEKTFNAKDYAFSLGDDLRPESFARPESQPSFSVNSFRTPAARRLAGGKLGRSRSPFISTVPRNSPFYKAKAVYGGAVSSTARMVQRGNSYVMVGNGVPNDGHNILSVANTKRARSISPLKATGPSEDIPQYKRRVVVKGDNHKAPEKSAFVAASDTAKRILKALDNISSPLNDAKRGPAVARETPLVSRRLMGAKATPRTSDRLFKQTSASSSVPPSKQLFIPIVKGTPVLGRSCKTLKRNIVRKPYVKDQSKSAVAQSKKPVEQAKEDEAKQDNSSAFGAGVQSTAEMKDNIVTKLQFPAVERPVNEKTITPVETSSFKFGLASTESTSPQKLSFGSHSAQAAPVGDSGAVHASMKMKRDRGRHEKAVHVEEEEPIEVPDNLTSVPSLPMAPGKPVFSIGKLSETKSSGGGSSQSSKFVFSEPEIISSQANASVQTGLSFSFADPVKSSSEVEATKLMPPPSPVKSASSSDGISLSGASSNVGLLPKTSSGSKWSCGACCIQNEEKAQKCVACEAPNPKAKTEVKPTSAAPSGGFSFAGTSLKPASSEGGKWTCGTCCVPNEAKDQKCVACETPNPKAKPSEAKPVPAAPTGGFSFAGTALKPTTSEGGKWTCGTCCVPNEAKDQKCVACETPNPKAKPSEANPASAAPSGGFSFAGTALKPTTPEGGKWTCGTCCVPNEAKDQKCVACETPNPNAKPSAPEKPSFGAGPTGGFSFGGTASDSNTKETDPFSAGGSNSSGTDSSKGSGFSFGASDKKSAFGAERADAQAPKGTGSGFSFGAKSKDSSGPSASSVFGSSNVEKPATQSAGFSFDGKSSSDAKVKSEDKKGDAGVDSDKKETPKMPASLSGFGGFGKTNSVETKPSETKPAFSFGSSTSADKASEPANSGVSGFGGFGKTSSSETKPSETKPAFSFGSSASADKASEPASSGASGFGGFGKAKSESSAGFSGFGSQPEKKENVDMPTTAPVASPFAPVTSAPPSSGETSSIFGKASASTSAFGFNKKEEKKEDTNSSVKSPFTFGATSVVSEAPSSATTTSAPAPFTFGGSSADAQPSSTGTATSAFGGSSTTTQPASTGPSPFTFGGSSSSAQQKENSSSTFAFGASTAATQPASTTGSSAFAFGGGASTTAQPNTQADSTTSSTPFAFGGADKPAGAFSFGSNDPATSASAAPAPVTAPTTFNFGASNNSGGGSAPFAFGGASSGAAPAAPAAQADAAAPGVFAFGASTPASTAPGPASTSAFGAPTAATSSTFAFGAPNGGNAAPPVFGFGAATTGAGAAPAAATPSFGLGGGGTSGGSAFGGGGAFGGAAAQQPQPAAAGGFGGFGGAASGPTGGSAFGSGVGGFGAAAAPQSQPSGGFGGGFGQPGGGAGQPQASTPAMRGRKIVKAKRKNRM